MYVLQIGVACQVVIVKPPKWLLLVAVGKTNKWGLALGLPCALVPNHAQSCGPFVVRETAVAIGPKDGKTQLNH